MMKYLLIRQLNKQRLCCLSLVFLVLIYLPFASIYQNYTAAHAYDLLNSEEKFLYDVMQTLTEPLVNDPVQLDALKGTIWSARIGGYKISDPLAVVSQSLASWSWNTSFAATALIPLLVSLLAGRIFCGWICPATLLYELNTNFALFLNKLGVPIHRWDFDRRLKYGVLISGTLVTMLSGLMILPAIYPPAIVGREIYYAIALDGFSISTIFFMLTMMADTFIARRGFCRYLCPGGALYSLLGRYRLLRIQRKVSVCNDCQRCDSICEFGLQPMSDQFGQECNNCTACIAICPTDSLQFHWTPVDQPYQGPGHQGRQYITANTDLIATDARSSCGE